MRFKKFVEETEMIKKIGIIGYSEQKFDKNKAIELLKEGLKHFNSNSNDEVISGYTDLGIPSLAYKIAKENEMVTVGIACSKAKDYDVFPVDKVYIKGEEWGDESTFFLSYITHLIKVGGGKQSIQEFKKFKGPKIEYELDVS